MEEMKYERIAEVMGRAHADVIQSVLEAKSSPVELIEESVLHSSYAAPLTPVQVFVVKAHAQRARELIRGLDGVVETEEDELQPRREALPWMSH